MISLGGLGAAPGGYQAAQARMFELQKQQQDQQAMAAYGQALAALAGQQGGQGPIPGIAPQQGGMPQGLTPQAPQGPAMPPGGTMQPNTGRFDDFNSGAQGGGPSPLLAALQARAAQQGGGAPSAQPPQSTAPTPPAQPPPVQGAASGGPLPPAPQQAAQPQIRMPSTAGVQPGTLTWASVVNAVKAANPNISPQALAGAVNNFVPLMQNEQAQQWKAIDEKRSQFEAQTGRISAERAGTPTGWRPDGQGGIEPIPHGPADLSMTNADDIVSGILDGSIPPPGAAGAPRYYKDTAPIVAKLTKQGYNTAASLLVWNATQRAAAAVNSPTNYRFRAAIDSALKSIDVLQKGIDGKGGVDAWNAQQWPAIVNRQIIEKAASGLLPGVDPKAAAIILSQYNEVVTQVAGALQSGGVPTADARRYAEEQINIGWAKGTIDDVIDQMRTNLVNRKQALEGQAPIVPGTASPSPTPAQPAPAPAAAAPANPYGEGTQHRDSTGRIWTIRNGQYVLEG